MNRNLTLALLALAVALGGIFVLSQQGISETQSLAWRVEQELVRIIPPNGSGETGEPTWFGLTIRRLAHIAEFFVLGLAAAAVALTLFGSGRQAVGIAAALCLAASVADELHKVFVPGRHFDPADLVLDALGYLLALLLVFALTQLVTRLH